MTIQNDEPGSDVSRRNFLKGSSLAAFMSMLGGVELKAEEPKSEPEAKKENGPPINCALIGLGFWGRELANNLSRVKQTRVVGLCDNYAPYLRRTAATLPEATATEDYRKLLADKNVHAVVVATPSHLHREIVVAALEAGKHVYCEAPLASTVEDARAIATAARSKSGQVFQAGLQMRSDPHRHFLLPFIRAGAQGKNIQARAQWHKKESWRRTSPNADREKLLNWRLRNETSPGLLGEIGIHQLDTVSWFYNQRPKAVTGFSSLLHWTDGRDVADTVQAVFDYPGGVRLLYDCSLCNSFDADYEMYYGTDAAVMLRESKAWMFKEADAPLLGWEVYARKDTFYKEIGIALVANATKIIAQTEKATSGAPFVVTPLFHALENFMVNVKLVKGEVEDFTANFGEVDASALKEHVATLTLTPTAGYKEGFEATVTALKANEAARKGSRIELNDDLFALA